MATIQYRTKESSINYRGARTDGGNKDMESKQKLTCRQTKETVMHQLLVCTRLAATKYTRKTVGKNAKWYKKK